MPSWELSDQVSVLGNHSFQVRAKCLSVGGAAEPSGLQAAFMHMCGCVWSVGCQIYQLSRHMTLLFSQYPRAGVRVH